MSEIEIGKGEKLSPIVHRNGIRLLRFDTIISLFRDKALKCQMMGIKDNIVEITDIKREFTARRAELTPNQSKKFNSLLGEYDKALYNIEHKCSCSPR